MLIPFITSSVKKFNQPQKRKEVITAPFLSSFHSSIMPEKDKNPGEDINAKEAESTATPPGTSGTTPSSPAVEDSAKETSGNGDESLSGIRIVPPPQDPVQSLAARDKAERVLRNRRALLGLLVADYTEKLHDPEDAKDEAEENFEKFWALKVPHEEAMELLMHCERKIRRELEEARTILEDAEPDMVKVRKATVASPDHVSLRRVRRAAEQARVIIQDWPAWHQELLDLAERAVERFYRPSLKREPSAAIVSRIKKLYSQVSGDLGLLDLELEELTSAPPSASTLEGSAAANSALASAVAEAKKPFARDFDITKYVHTTFTGDKSSAFGDFHTWMEMWRHASAQVAATCKEVDSGALLHLFRAVVGGSAAKLTSAALSIEAAIALLEDQYNDVVALVESYIPLPADKDSKTGEERMAEAGAFAERWPQIRGQLANHEVEMDDFHGIRAQLAALGHNATVKWKTHVKGVLRELPEGSKLGKAYNWPEFVKWLKKIRDEEAAARATEDGSSASIFAIVNPGNNTPTALVEGCLVCGTGASHRSADCSKVGDLTSDAYQDLCIQKGLCKRCAQAKWSTAHHRACSSTCSTCNKGHLTLRHRHAPTASGKKRHQEQGKRDFKRPRADPSREPTPAARPDQAKFDEAVELGVKAQEARRALNLPASSGKALRGKGNKFHGSRGGKGGKGGKGNMKKEASEKK